MNRIDRICAILIQLQHKRVVRAQEIASRFHISLRTVYRDIQTLGEAGIPIIGEAGVGYSIMEGYRLPPVMFTMEEATAFLTAEKVVSKFTDPSTIENYASAMYKIRAVLSSAEKVFFEKSEDQIQVLKKPASAPVVDNVIPAILKSINEKRVLFITYHSNSNGEISGRKIEPVGISYITNSWQLIAFCQMRNSYRNFRIDRIGQLRLTGDVFKKSHPSLPEYLEQVTSQQQFIKIVVQVEKTVLKHIADQKFYQGFVSERVLMNKTEMTFLAPTMEGFVRWFISFADQAIIIQPELLKLRLRELTGSISKKII